MTKHLVLALTGLAVSLPAMAQPDAPREVSIPFAANGGIRDWEAEGDKSILLRDRTNRWYRATFVGRCPRVGYSNTLVFETDPSGTFDRFSSIKSEYGNCQVGSIVRAEAPKSKGGK
ncbi:hypothetical protein H9L12_10460 [Sphingomonas rhizophila]|uniref:Beta/gamma crystallin family protein n=1 Tax=Sphingomonas rhizophila TaxID=2071607 RepID=A0A7G9SA11_9SPHN|nr:DUF6491 family protein [Sphingomonas rhizophila]QNN64686.1 hypothetical protein H9L12_10460 [Sphingomonas rhizophila]